MGRKHARFIEWKSNFRHLQVRLLTIMWWPSSISFSILLFTNLVSNLSFDSCLLICIQHLFISNYFFSPHLTTSIFSLGHITEALCSAVASVMLMSMTVQKDGQVKCNTFILHHFFRRNYHRNLWKKGRNLVKRVI